MIDFPARIKEARRIIGYSLKKAAEKSGIEISKIKAFEGGKKRPLMSELSKLANTYKIEFSAFFSDEKIKREKFLWCKT
jgi:transcriptional regulator with XRE-family HTH domain